MSLGKIIRYLRPGENNPRNSEGAFYTFPNGRIIFIYSKYKGTSHGDNASCDLYMLESLDNGETFTDARTVFTCEELGAQNIMSVSLLGLSDGRVGLFFIKKMSSLEYTIMLSKSEDGTVWTEPKRILSEDGYYILNNDRVIRLRDGRIVMPYSYMRPEEVLTKDGKKLINNPGLIYIYGSDDEENFYRISTAYGITGNPGRGCLEPLLIQHTDGTVECYTRTTLGYQYKMTALDDTLNNWTPLDKSIFKSQDAPLCMKYLRDDVLFAVWCSQPENADPQIYGGERNSSGRCYYVYSISRDGGKTYSEPRVLEHDETRGFCYCAIEPTRDGSVLLAYCSGGGGEEAHCLARTTIRKVKIEELL